MAQFLRPNSDTVTNANWTTTPYWSNLDEVTLSDTDFVSCGDSANVAFELGLTTAEIPQSGTRTLRVRCKKGAAAGNARGLNYNLKQGGTSVQSGTINAALTETYSTVAITISNSITDYTSISLELTSTGTISGSGASRRTVQVSWVEFEIPDRQIQIYNETIDLDTTITDTYTSTSIMDSSVSLDMDIDVIFNNTLDIEFTINLDSTITDDYSVFKIVDEIIELLTDNGLDVEPTFIYNPQIDLDSTITDTYTSTSIMDSSVSLDMDTTLESEISISFDETFILDTTITDDYSVSKIVDQIINLDTDIQIDIESSKSGVFTIKVKSVNSLSMTTNKPLIIKWRK